MNRKKKKMLLVKGLMMVTVVAMAACSTVSFTHANGEKGQSVTNAEVQPDNTVILTYPNGSACIDTNPGKSQVCREL